MHVSYYYYYCYYYYYYYYNYYYYYYYYYKNKHYAYNFKSQYISRLPLARVNCGFYERTTESHSVEAGNSLQNSQSFKLLLLLLKSLPLGTSFSRVLETIRRIKAILELQSLVPTELRKSASKNHGIKFLSANGKVFFKRLTGNDRNTVANLRDCFRLLLLLFS